MVADKGNRKINFKIEKKILKSSRNKFQNREINFGNQEINSKSRNKFWNQEINFGIKKTPGKHFRNQRQYS